MPTAIGIGISPIFLISGSGSGPDTTKYLVDRFSVNIVDRFGVQIITR